MNKIDAFLEEHDPSAVKSYILDEIRKSGVDLEGGILQAHDLTLSEARQKRSHYMGRNWMADTMNGNIVGKFRDDYRDLMFVDDEGTPYLLIGKDIRIYFKKLGKKYNPNNIPTKHVADLWSHNGGYDGNKIHTLYVGYKLLNDKVWETVTGTYGAYPNNFFRKKMDWIIDLGNLAHGLTIPIAPILDNPIDGEDFEIKPKQIEKTGDK